MSILEVARLRFLRIAIPVPWVYFGGIGTRIGIKEIVKGIEKESFSYSQFLISQQAEGIVIHDSKFEESCHL